MQYSEWIPEKYSIEKMYLVLMINTIYRNRTDKQNNITLRTAKDEFVFAV